MNRLLLCVALIGCCFGQHVSAVVIRVKPSADSGNSNNGSGWGASKVTNLQRALLLAQVGDEIWVADGIYYPDEGQNQIDDDRNSMFYVKAGVNLYGGFAGNEKAREARDPIGHVAIFSGDINQDESGISFGDYIPRASILANAYHVLWLERGSGTITRISGITITAGCAWTTTPEEPNHGKQGGGLYSPFASAEITDCNFINNYGYEGGGAYLGDDGNPPPVSYSGISFVNCRFESNLGYSGGAVFTEEASPSFDKCLFRENGFPLNYSGLNGSSIGSGNNTYSYSSVGGAIYGVGDSEIRITGSEFTENTACAIGGLNILLRVESTIFDGNITEGGGSAINLTATYPFGEEFEWYTLVAYNCLFVGNITENFGAGAIAVRSIRPILTNCTFTQNEAVSGYGSIYLHTTEAVFSNLLVWDNLSYGSSDTPMLSSNGGEQFIFTSPSIAQKSGILSPSNIVVKSSLIASRSGHINNINGLDPGNDPMFIAADDFRLSLHSPAIGMGDKTVDLDDAGPGINQVQDLLTDVNGNPRVSGNHVDIGAYEFVYDGANLDSDSDGLSDAFEAMFASDASNIGLLANGDEDLDGFSNLEEFVFGTNPTISDQGALAQLFFTSGFVFDGMTSETHNYLNAQYTFNRDALAYIRVVAECSSDLTTWSSDDILSYDLSFDETNTAIQSFRSYKSAQENDAVFIRLRLLPK
ncbi:MAG TPA: hypothetical protein DCX06_06230 [Opitutae bacterium]|nr:hypothetical protein [Opitutae bacterium]